jgi:hypothetical protein
VANNVVQAEANRLLDASFATTAYSAPTGPMKLHLMTANGSATATGTEVTGGSYAAQTITMGAAAAGAAANNSTISFTSMPVATVTGVDITDAAGTRRQWWGALSTTKTLAAGDTLSFAASSISASIS